MGDFNAEEVNIYIKGFCNLYRQKNLNKVLTFKKPDNPKTIDLRFDIDKLSSQFSKIMCT